MLRCLEEVRAAGAGVLVTVVEVRGSAPREVGAKMVVFPDGHIEGTIGGGCVEVEMMEEARRVLQSGRPRMCQVDLLEDSACERAEKACGGIMRLFVEPLL